MGTSEILQLLAKIEGLATVDLDDLDIVELVGQIWEIQREAQVARHTIEILADMEAEAMCRRFDEMTDAQADLVSAGWGHD